MQEQQNLMTSFCVGQPMAAGHPLNRQTAYKLAEHFKILHPTRYEQVQLYLGSLRKHLGRPIDKIPSTFLLRTLKPPSAKPDIMECMGSRARLARRMLVELGFMTRYRQHSLQCTGQLTIPDLFEIFAPVRSGACVLCTQKEPDQERQVTEMTSLSQRNQPIEPSSSESDVASDSTIIYAPVRILHEDEMNASVESGRLAALFTILSSEALSTSPSSSTETTTSSSPLPPSIAPPSIAPPLVPPSARVKITTTTLRLHDGTSVVWYINNNAPVSLPTLRMSFAILDSDNVLQESDIAKVLHVTACETLTLNLFRRVGFGRGYFKSPSAEATRRSKFVVVVADDGEPGQQASKASEKLLLRFALVMAERNVFMTAKGKRHDGVFMCNIAPPLSVSGSTLSATSEHSSLLASGRRVSAATIDLEGTDDDKDDVIDAAGVVAINKHDQELLEAKAQCALVAQQSKAPIVRARKRPADQLEREPLEEEDPSCQRDTRLRRTAPQACRLDFIMLPVGDATSCTH